MFIWVFSSEKMFTQCREHVYFSPDSRIFYDWDVFFHSVLQPQNLAAAHSTLSPPTGSSVPVTPGFFHPPRQWHSVQLHLWHRLGLSLVALKVTVIVIYYLHWFTEHGSLYKQADIFQLCLAMDKLFCIETVLLQLVEMGIVDVCVIHVQIIHPCGGGEGRGSPRWLLFNF